jgi:hypothetical protein
MSYLGYTKIISNYAKILTEQGKGVITILEIGVDKGQTTLPLLHNLITNEVEFIFVGVDIRRDPTFVEQLVQMDGVRAGFMEPKNPNYYYLIENSLDWFPYFVEHNPDFKFDIILLDGDHNYPTVSKELEYFNQLTMPHSLCVLDDYYGKYAHKDDYYADKPSHVGLNHKSFAREGEGHGMQKAVQDYLAQNPQWTFYGEELHKGDNWEPAIITRDLTLELQNGEVICFGSREASGTEKE